MGGNDFKSGVDGDELVGDHDYRLGDRVVSIYGAE